MAQEFGRSDRLNALERRVRELVEIAYQPAGPAGSGIPATILDAKGDLIVASAADVAARFAVGGNDAILMADSAQAVGIKWAPPGVPGTAAFSDAPAEGTTDGYARTDHKHGMPSAPVAGAPSTTDYLVGTADGGLSNEIVVGTTPGGELGGTWASPTVDATHSGSAHHAAVTLAADADVLLGLSGQEINFDTQSANRVLAGPASGGAADPTFRALVAGDMPSRVVALRFDIDGGGATITTGIKGDIEVPFAMTIVGWTLLADQAGAIQIDIWKDVYANYPPVVGDSITGADPPLIAATGDHAQDLAPSGWSTMAIAAGDTLRFNVDSVTSIQRVSLIIRGTVP